MYSSYPYKDRPFIKKKHLNLYLIVFIVTIIGSCIFHASNITRIIIDDIDDAATASASFIGSNNIIQIKHIYQSHNSGIEYEDDTDIDEDSSSSNNMIDGDDSYRYKQRVLMSH